MPQRVFDYCTLRSVSHRVAAREKEAKKLKAQQKKEASKFQEGQKGSNPSKKNPKRGAEEENSEDYADPETPFGEKKQLSSQMAKQYCPSFVEKSWYAWWENSGFFVADPKSSKPPFVIGWTSEQIESEMDHVEVIVKSLRSLRSQSLPNERHDRRKAYVVCQNATIAEIIKSHELEISTLASLSSLEVLGENDDKPTDCGVEVVNEHLSVYLHLRGALNPSELEKLMRKEEDARKQRDSLANKMEASGYKQKVPLKIQEDNLAKLDSLTKELINLEDAIQFIQMSIKRTLQLKVT